MCDKRQDHITLWLVATLRHFRVCSLFVYFAKFSQTATAKWPFTVFKSSCHLLPSMCLTTQR